MTTIPTIPTITIYDEITSFTIELGELLKEDWKNFKIFIKKNKNYCLWILILFITLQFTDLLNLGASWNRYCSKNDINKIHVQSGGEGGPIEVSNQKKAEKEQKKAEKEQKKADKQQKKDEKKANKLATKQSMRMERGTGMGPGINRVFSMVSGMFVIISFILVVIGIISLPIIVFIVITYTILKYMVSNVSIL